MPGVSFLLRRRLLAALLLVAAAIPAAGVHAADAKPADKSTDDPASITDPDFALQGEYAGDVTTADGSKKIGVQIIALGKGKFRAVAYVGGLPGDGWEGTAVESPSEGELKDGVVTFQAENHGATLKDGVLTITGPAGVKLGETKKVNRVSPTMGAAPPSGAIVLFNGTSADNFEKGRMTPAGLLMQGATSKQTFQNATLHVEFMLPFMPEARGQGRGNSGCYLQGRYEVQVLDSFGLKGENNECGGIYTIKAPSVNMCFPPMAWQTYDIDFTAAEYADGKKVKNGTITVRHNGVEIQKATELTGATRAAPVKEGPEPGPLYIQDHGNPVRYRNIWLVEKK